MFCARQKDFRAAKVLTPTMSDVTAYEGRTHVLPKPDGKRTLNRIKKLLDYNAEEKRKKKKAEEERQRAATTTAAAAAAPVPVRPDDGKTRACGPVAAAPKKKKKPAKEAKTCGTERVRVPLPRPHPREGVC